MSDISLTPTTMDSTTPASTSIRQIQKQLLLLLHSHTCLKKDLADPERQQTCPVAKCVMMRGVWLHIKSCVSVKERLESCPHPHCFSSLKILAHWKTCRDPHCPLCQLVRWNSREYHQRQQQQQVNVGVVSSSSGLVGDLDSLDPPPPPETSEPVSVSCSSSGQSTAAGAQGYPSSQCHWNREPGSNRNSTSASTTGLRHSSNPTSSSTSASASISSSSFPDETHLQLQQPSHSHSSHPYPHYNYPAELCNPPTINPDGHNCSSSSRGDYYQHHHYHYRQYCHTQTQRVPIHATHATQATTTTTTSNKVCDGYPTTTTQPEYLTPLKIHVQDDNNYNYHYNYNYNQWDDESLVSQSHCQSQSHGDRQNANDNFCHIDDANTNGAVDIDPFTTHLHQGDRHRSTGSTRDHFCHTNPYLDGNGNDDVNVNLLMECRDNEVGRKRGRTHTFASSEAPTALEVRRAYEQLGIPCPVDALKRLMATLPGGLRESAKIEAKHRTKHQRLSTSSAVTMRDSIDTDDEWDHSIPEGDDDKDVFNLRLPRECEARLDV